MCIRLRDINELARGEFVRLFLQIAQKLNFAIILRLEFSAAYIYGAEF